MNKPLLVVGNKNYSSWSLRAWLGLKAAGIDFEEKVIPLDTAQFKADILAISGAGFVPALVVDDMVVWDSLAILEWAAERAHAGWPADLADRAHARSVCAEMHSGFAALRREMPMNMRAEGRQVVASAEALADIERIQAIWRECRSRRAPAGPYLYGSFTNADAMFAPVASRFRTYGVHMDQVSQAFVDAVHDHPDFMIWRRGAEREPWTIEREEVGN